MNASVNIERNSWRLPPDETVQVADPRSKSAQVKEVNRSSSRPSGIPSFVSLQMKILEAGIYKSDACIRVYVLCT